MTNPHTKITKQSTVSQLLNNISTTKSPLSAYSAVNKTELVNLMLQTLNDLGLQKTKTALLQEAQSVLEIYNGYDDSNTQTASPEDVSSKLVAFFSSISNGQFDEAEQMIDNLDLRDDQEFAIDNDRGFCSLRDLNYINDNPRELNGDITMGSNDNSKLKLRFAIKRHKFWECLFADENPKAALLMLKSEILPNFGALFAEEIDTLSSMIISSEGFEHYLELHGFSPNGNLEQCRGYLINSLVQYISSRTLMPPHRLCVLLEQAQKYQKSLNLLSVSTDSHHWSLYENIKFPEEKFPCKVLQSIDLHPKEVWFVKFSHSGKYLAVITDSETVVIYTVGDFNYKGDLPEFKLHKMLRGHSKPVYYCSWLNDDSKIITGSADSSIKIWDVSSGELLRSVKFSLTPDLEVQTSLIPPAVKACQWLPNGEGFVAGSTEKEMIYFTKDGERKFRWVADRVLDICVTPDSQYVLTISTKYLSVFNLKSKQKIRRIQFDQTLSSIVLSKKNSNHVLIQGFPDLLQLWDWKAELLVKRFVGQKQGSCIIRSCFSSGNEDLLLSGTADGRVCVWSTQYSALMLGLKGHESLVNCVDYNPNIPWMFVSGSDDGYLLVWGPNEVLKEAKMGSGKPIMPLRRKTVKIVEDDGDDEDDSDEEDNEESDDDDDNGDSELVNHAVSFIQPHIDANN